MRLYIDHSNYIYVRIQALIWLSNGLGTPTNLEPNGAGMLTEIYNSIATEKPLVLDFYHVESLMDRCLEQFIQAIQKGKREVSFINIQKIEYDLDSVIGEFYQKKIEKNTFEGVGRIFTVNPGSSTEIYASVEQEIENQLHTNVKNYVKNVFEKFDQSKYLHSTPYKSSGSFDASRLIQNREAFLWISLLMAKKVDEVIEKYQLGSKDREIKLLTVSLRSSPFAASIALINNLSIQTIDHLGPRHKVFDMDIIDSFKENKSNTYIYIGDFCIGGTEIKIAQTYANIQSSELQHAVVIGSLFMPEVFETSFTLHPLVQLKGIHSEATFSI